MSRKLLITGIPATGKTAIGNYLAEHHDFRHIDMEVNNSEQARALHRDPEAFLDALPSGNVVLTWGFSPVESLLAVRWLVEQGFELFWLDGNHVAALQRFLEREQYNRAMEYAYYVQMAAILASGVVQVLTPVIIDPFTPSGTLAPTAETAGRIISA